MSSLKRRLSNELTDGVQHTRHKLNGAMSPGRPSDIDPPTRTRNLDNFVITIMKAFNGVRPGDPLRAGIDGIYELFSAIAQSLPLESRSRVKYLLYFDVKDVARYPDLQADLLQAWRDQSFDSIRQRLLDGNNNIRLASEIKVTAIQRAWQEPYMRYWHQVMYDNINNMARNMDYSNTVSIIQSAGTGKSRMVDEMAKLVFTIPFNLHLRDKSAFMSLVYPPPDEEVRNYFETRPKETYGQYRTRIYAFFKYLFIEVWTAVNASFGFGHSHRDLAQLWRNYLQLSDNREKLYRSVIDRCKEASTVRTRSMSYIPPVFIILQEVHYAAHEAIQELEKLLACIPDVESAVRAPDTLVKLVLYFDDSQMFAQEHVAEGEDSYSIFLSCFNSFRLHNVIGILISTHSHISYADPPKEPYCSSGRAPLNYTKFQAPITETAFDCHPSFPLKPGQYTLSDVASVEFMARFGRPLFWSLLNGARLSNNPDEYDMVCHSLVDLAREKLLGRHNVDLDRDKVSRSGQIAIADVRLLLDFVEGLNDSHQMGVALVNKHLRTAWSIPSHRRYMISGYPSEPIIAEAAARQMHLFRRETPQPQAPVLDILRREVAGGLLDLDDLDKLVARTLLMEAYDRAIEREQGFEPGVTYPFYSQGCSVITFIEELFHEDTAREILDSVPDNVVAGESLREAFKDAVVRFTHFVKLDDDSGVSTNAVFAAFIKCVAFMDSHSQQGAHIVIPILLRRDALLSEKATSGLFVQVIRRRRMCSPAELKIEPQDLGFFPLKDEARPYIGMTMELGVKGKPPVGVTTEVRILTGRRVHGTTVNSTAAGVAIGFDEAFEKPSPPLTSTAHDAISAVHPRYTLIAYGCSNNVYKGVQKGDEHTYGYLLSPRNFLEEHGRLDKDSHLFVLRQQPFWSRGGGYQWVKDEMLNESGEESLKRDERMLVIQDEQMAEHAPDEELCMEVDDDNLDRPD
ncbi:hypothetical protein EW146_g1744 [Bondarzewia mesenterica]|uniref:Uncharacterized protein n=1 Tax=Bondarzewia mesenterica TaxID=1095465 RepID=A0A4S4M550_9AGAM|nr:hypothetical protein EW146_g1744 [Bondarzewia mesenterica]